MHIQKSVQKLLFIFFEYMRYHQQKIKFKRVYFIKVIN